METGLVLLAPTMTGYRFFFEQGVAGFVALIIAAGTLVYKARYTPALWLFSLHLVQSCS